MRRDRRHEAAGVAPGHGGYGVSPKSSSIVEGHADAEDRNETPQGRAAAAAYGPRLFEKGSFAEHKVRHGGSGDRGDPISTGRSSRRGGGGAMGAYADYAQRSCLNEADSRRSSRRSSRRAA